MKLTNIFAAASIVAAAAIVMSGVSYAATYAYVNSTGDVRTTEASTPEQAIMTAPGIGIHSGVILVDDASDAGLVGDSVSGT